MSVTFRSHQEFRDEMARKGQHCRTVQKRLEGYLATYHENPDDVQLRADIRRSVRIFGGITGLRKAIDVEGASAAIYESLSGAIFDIEEGS